MKLNILYSLPSYGTVLSIYAINNYESFPNFCLAVLPIFLTILSSILLACKKNGIYSFKYKAVEPSEFLLFPAYIGLYVIALILQWNYQSWLILGVLFIVWFRLETVCYFNIVWSIMGYRFYRVTTPDGTIVNVVCKSKDWKMPSGEPGEGLPKIKQLKVINNFTYIQHKPPFPPENNL